MTNTRKGASEASPGGAPTQARPEAAGVASGCAQTSNEHAGDNAMHTGSSAGGGAGTAPHALPGARLGACRNFLVAIDAKDVPVSLTAAFYAGWDARERRLANETSRPLSSRAAEDVLAERERQTSAEGWTVEHDDEHTDGSLAMAAACYALPPDQRRLEYRPFERDVGRTVGEPIIIKDRVRVPFEWPGSWHGAHWKPKVARIKAYVAKLLKGE